jgi:hypothetical protein
MKDIVPLHEDIHLNVLFNMAGEPMYQKKPSWARTSWKDIAIIAAVVLFVGGPIAGCTYMALDSSGAGPECLFIHCVKVLR